VKFQLHPTVETHSRSRIFCRTHWFVLFWQP
jgi:hypothetical protein